MRKVVIMIKVYNRTINKNRCNRIIMSSRNFVNTYHSARTNLHEELPFTSFSRLARRRKERSLKNIKTEMFDKFSKCQGAILSPKACELFGWNTIKKMDVRRLKEDLYVFKNNAFLHSEDQMAKELRTNDKGKIVLPLRKYEEESVEALEEWNVKKCLLSPATNSKYKDLIELRVRRSFMVNQKCPPSKFSTWYEYDATPKSTHTQSRCETEFSLRPSRPPIFEPLLAAKYQETLELLEKKQCKRQSIVNEKNQLHTRVKGLRIQSMQLKEEISQLRRNGANTDYVKLARTLLARRMTNKLSPFHVFTKTTQKRNLLQKNQEEIEAAKKCISKLEEKLSKITGKTEVLKAELAKTRQELTDYYHDVLERANEVRDEGIKWTLKAIWGVKGNVKTCKFPNFLDPESIQYLLKTAEKELCIIELRRKMAKIKGDDELKEKEKILEKVEQLGKEIKEDKEKEATRLSHEFRKNNYGIKYNISKNVLFSVIFGPAFAKQKAEPVRSYFSVLLLSSD